MSDLLCGTAESNQHCESPGAFPPGTLVKNPSASAGDPRDAGWIPGSGRFPGVGNGNPLQYSCLEYSMDRAWWATVHGVTKSQTQLSMRTKEELK